MTEHLRPAVESVDRALQLILALQTGKALSVRAAAAELNVAESTAHRLLTTLVGRGFAVQDSSRRYVAGPSLGGLNASPLSHNDLIELARPVLSFLNTAVDETAHLAVRNGPMVLYLDGVESESNALRIGLRVGHRMPAYCTAGGRAMLAELTNDKVEEIYRGGLPSWPAARITTISALKRRLGTARRDGYAACFEEHERGVVSFGVAVRSGGAVVCSLAYAIPTVRYRRADTPRYAANLMEGAQLLQTKLATSTP